jgi:RHS repeat-associated protein
VNRFYTARGQLESVGWGAGATSYVYLRDGKVDFQARTGGEVTSYGYDGRGLVSSVRHSQGGHDLAYREYWRDNRDRILGWKRGTDNSRNGMEDGSGDRYHYDYEGQLDHASYRMAHPENSPGPALRADSFQYDRLGNRMGSNHVASRGTMTFTRKDNGLNQYSGWWPYSGTYYDDDVGGGWGAPHEANGVLMQDGWITAGFNALNQPISIWSPMYPGGSSPQWMWFGYDPLGRCVKRWVGPTVDNHAPPANSNPATYYYYDGSNMIQEGPSNGPASRVYVHGGGVDEIVASQVGAVWSHHHYDGQGNCIMLTDTNGGIREQYDYDAFGMPYFYTANGNKVGAPQQWGNRFLFTGREWLKDLKLYDYRARLYQPELGRFLQPDPKEFAAGDYNLYRYCHNDPVNKSDPTGLKEQLVGSITVELQKLRTTTGSNIPQWVTILKGVADGALKAAFISMIQAAVGNPIAGKPGKTDGDHIDRTKSLYTNGSFSKDAKAFLGTHRGTAGPFVRDNHFSEITPQESPVAFILHFHNNIQNVSTANPSDMDADAVKSLQAPMLFSSESLYRQNQGVLLRPNGISREPTQIPVLLNW